MIELTGRLQEFVKVALNDCAGTYNTWELACRCVRENVPGDFVECGVYSGVQIAAMAEAVLVHQAAPRQIHLFDSFEGIPKPGPRDIQIRDLLGDGDGELISTGVAICDLEHTRRNLREWGFPDEWFVWHAGWFQHTVPQFAPRPLALLRLDGDLYESTKACLPLADLVVPGGFVIIDDWPLDGCQAAVKEYWAARGQAPETHIAYTGEGRPLWWQVTEPTA